VARLAWPFALLSVLAVIYQRLGVLMLSTLATDAQAGWYAAAMRIIEPLKMLHFAVLGALLPALSHLAAPINRQQHLLATSLFRRSLLFLLIFSLFAGCVIVVLAQPIVMLLFGATYAPAVEVVQLLAVSVLPYTISASLSLRLVTQGRERRVLGATMLSVIVAFLLNRGLIPAAGPNGAALAVIGSESFLALMMLVLRH
ncbi:MAG TPA: polysaccharide biosynthesis C-terminal domain-containing protein, partial [Anaerolineae bacterium]|nr:polysaccharide biosynthesis C-terminal domain-containing protein [Anaerolineae bacterium]